MFLAEFTCLLIDEPQAEQLYTTLMRLRSDAGFTVPHMLQVSVVYSRGTRTSRLPAPSAL